jgi:hypothetical protein
MHTHLAAKWQAVGTRCSIYASCLCATALVFINVCPRYAFNLSDHETAAILSATGDFTMLLSILNAMFAIGMLARFPATRESPWLWAAVTLPAFVMLLTPAIQTA